MRGSKYRSRHCFLPPTIQPPLFPFLFSFFSLSLCPGPEIHSSEGIIRRKTDSLPFFFLHPDQLRSHLQPDSYQAQTLLVCDLVAYVGHPTNVSNNNTYHATNTSPTPTSSPTPAEKHFHDGVHFVGSPNLGGGRTTS